MLQTGQNEAEFRNSGTSRTATYPGIMRLDNNACAGSILKGEVIQAVSASQP